MAVNRKETPYGSIDERTQVYNRRGGSDLVTGASHSGRFSDDNPYAYQLETARSSDVDALFERAFEWESNRLALLEQRAYDDPSAVVARQRAAGLNPDLLTGGSGGSGGSSAQMTPVDGDEPFGGARQELMRAQATQATVSSIFAPLSAVSGIVQTAVGATDAISTLPARIGLTEAQSGLANEQATLVGEQAETMRQMRPINLLGAQLQNVRSQLDNLGEYSSLFTSETPDADILDLLGTLGYNDAQKSSMLSNIRSVQNNPALQALYTENRLKARQREAQDAVYTPQYIADLEGFSSQIALQEQRYKLGNVQLRNAVQDYIIADGTYTKNVASSQLEDARAGNVQSQLARQKVEHNLKAFVASVEVNKKLYNEYKAEIESIYAGANFGGLSSIEKLRVRSLQAKMTQLTTLTDTALNDTFSLANDLYANSHYNEYGTFEVAGVSLPNPFYDVMYKPLFKFDANSIFNGKDTSTDLYNSLLHRTMPNAYDENGEFIALDRLVELGGKLIGNKSIPVK